MDDAGSMRSGPATPASGVPRGEPPGVRAQLGDTFEAVKRLLRAHIDLAKAEAADIAGQVGRVIGLGVFAFVLAIIALTLLTLGGLMFLGELLFGSIGWGVLLGTVLLIDIAIVAALLAIDVSGRRIGTSFLIAALVGVGVGLVFAFDVLHQGWRAVGDAVGQPIIGDQPTRTVVIAIVGLAAAAGLLGFIGGLRGGIKGAFVAFIVAAFVGGFLGLVTSAQVPANSGAALGILVALILWPILAARDLRRTGIDSDALKAKFYPTETVNLTKETIEWVRARTPLVPKS